ncbi:MFS transporter [Acetobacteraceae bacterium H6797]|nr:MFS transporter [Acetobacteraceae bacterium H6797]
MTAPSAQEADAASRQAALTLACTLPGDTLLYLLLPLHHGAFGVSLMEAGVLLAANRLVRIAGYGQVARFYGRRGPRDACFLAAIGAVLATLGYALLSGVWALLVARLLWGLAFAALNIANQALPTALQEGAARRAGRARSIAAAGPMLGLLLGAALAEVAGPRPVFLLLAVAALPALWTARRLPSAPEAMRASGARLALPRVMDVWSFCLGLTLDGLFVLGLAVLASASLPQGAGLAAGAAMALRYASEIFLSPVGGALAQRVGARRLLVALSLAASAGLLLLGTGGAWLWAGALGTVLSRALLQPLPGPVVAAESPGEARVPALARQATWRDIGAGLGPLAAGMLLPVAPALLLYGGAGLLLAGVSLAVARPSKGRAGAG